MVNYKKFIQTHKFKTGDLLLFSHKDNCKTCCNCLFTCFTDIIKCCTNSEYSHSAIIIENPRWRPDLKGYFVLQSSYETFPDVEDHELKLGAELVSLEELFDNYEGKIYWRRISCVRDDQFYENLMIAHSAVHNRPYDVVPLDWFEAATHFYTKDREQLKTRFWCSALVSYIYVELGLFDNDIPWSMISPQMLSSSSKYPKFKDCLIYKEVRVL